MKHVEFHSKNKFEKLVHLVGFIIKKISKKMFSSNAPRFPKAHCFLGGAPRLRPFVLLISAI
jgi:hypothetical protein